MGGVLEEHQGTGRGEATKDTDMWWQGRDRNAGLRGGTCVKEASGHSGDGVTFNLLFIRPVFSVAVTDTYSPFSQINMEL